MVILLLAGLGLSHAPLPPVPFHESAYIPPNLYLVRTTTLNVRMEGPNHPKGRGHLRITSVVAGPARLAGKEFDCLVGPSIESAPISGFGPTRVPAVPDLEEGGTGLWWVYADQNSRTLHPELRWEQVEKYRLDGFPYQGAKRNVGLLGLYPDMSLTEIAGPKLVETIAELNRKDITMWTEAVAAVYNARTDADRRVLLEKYAATPKSWVSGWAIALLARGPKEPAIKFLQGLTSSGKIHYDAQITLDQKLCQLEPKDWLRSSLRQAMLRRWLDPKSSANLFGWGCKRLEEAVWTGEMGAEMFADALGPALAVADQLTEYQTQKLESILKGITFKPADRKKGFNFLTRTVRTAKSVRLRGAAVRGLQNFWPPTADELKDVRQLRETERDPGVAAALDRILALPQ